MRKRENASAEILLGPESFVQGKQSSLEHNTPLLTVQFSNGHNGIEIGVSQGHEAQVQTLHRNRSKRSLPFQSPLPRKTSSASSNLVDNPIQTRWRSSL